MSGNDEKVSLAEYFNEQSNDGRTGDEEIERVPAWCEVPIHSQTKHFQTGFQWIDWANEKIVRKT